jgi:hypothetical protein
VNNINASTVVAVTFAIALVIAIFRFDDLKAGISALGVKLNLTGRSARSQRGSSSEPAPSSGGIRRNWFFGKTIVKTTGRARVDDNLTAGNADFDVEDLSQQQESRDKRKPRS